MPFLKSVRVNTDKTDSTSGHPFDVPAIAAMIDDERSVKFHRSVTIFVGDNGSGKSTLLEAIAVNQGMNAEGGARGMQFSTADSTVSQLHQHLRVSRSHHQPDDVFFLRAESFFNVATAIDGYGSASAYGGSLHERSHGESFIDLIVHRFGADSLFLLDEPEAALSIHGQLQFLVRLHDLVEQGSQFIIATHSPLLMAYPNAVIYNFTNTGPTTTKWREVDTVQLMTDFLANADGFLSELLTDEDR